MQNCKKCQRELMPGESDKCPACESEASHKWKKVTEAVVPLAIGAVAVGIKLISNKNKT